MIKLLVKQLKYFIIKNYAKKNDGLGSLLPCLAKNN